jgi:hypothetical protein
MSGLLWFSKVPEGPTSRLQAMARTPLALMHQCPPCATEGRPQLLASLAEHRIPPGPTDHPKGSVTDSVTVHHPGRSPTELRCKPGQRGAKRVMARKVHAGHLPAVSRFRRSFVGLASMHGHDRTGRSTELAH